METGLQNFKDKVGVLIYRTFSLLPEPEFQGATGPSFYVYKKNIKSGGKLSFVRNYHNVEPVKILSSGNKLGFWVNRTGKMRYIAMDPLFAPEGNPTGKANYLIGVQDGKMLMMYLRKVGYDAEPKWRALPDANIGPALSDILLGTIDYNKGVLINENTLSADFDVNEEPQKFPTWLKITAIAAAAAAVIFGIKKLIE